MCGNTKTKKRISYPNLTANIESDGLIHEAKITDINCQGARIDKKIAPADCASIILFRKKTDSFYRIKEHKCQIIKLKDQPYTEIRFIDCLTQTELEILGIDN